MQKIAKFYRVSSKQFKEGMNDCFPQYSDGEISDMYESIRLPERATKGSAGYDFFAPVSFCLAPGESVKIPTGVRVKMDEEWVFMLYPRSGLGSKYRFQLNNTVGIIDSDYFYSDNEGHIFSKLINDSRDGKTIKIAAGERFMQGIFLQYGITTDDEANGIRNGGFGSTANFI